MWNLLCAYFILGDVLGIGGKTIYISGKSYNQQCLENTSQSWEQYFCMYIDSLNIVWGQFLDSSMGNSCKVLFHYFLVCLLEFVRLPLPFVASYFSIFYLMSQETYFLISYWWLFWNVGNNHWKPIYENFVVKICMHLNK